MSIVFNSCTTLTNADFQGKTGYWQTNGVAPAPEAVIVHDGEALPDGTTVPATLMGACTRLMTGFIPTGERQCCNFYSGWANDAKNWDFNGNEILKLRIYTNNPNLTFNLYVKSAMWVSIADITTAPGDVPINQWVELTVDLRALGASPLVLSEGFVVALHVEAIGDQYTTYVLTQNWTVEPPSGTPALGCNLSPPAATVERNELAAFTSTVWGGVPPYSVEWMLDGQNVETDTISATGGTAAYNFFSDVVGTHQLYVRVLDSDSPQKTIMSTISNIVIRKPTPARVPCKPLHRDGNKLKDDTGKEIHLHGVNWHGFEDHPYGHVIDVNGGVHYGLFDVAMVRQMLDALVEWGANLIRCHMSLSCWKGNYGNVQTNFQTFLTEANQRGIYVLMEFFDIGYYNMGGVGDPAPYLPVNRSTPVSDVTGYSGVTWAQQADVIPDANTFAQFWGTIAEQLKNNPNIMFEFWNEPHEPESAAGWFATTQLCINAVRNAGATQPIVVQWHYGVSYYEGQPLLYSAVPWFQTYVPSLNDPLNNIVVSTHCYRDQYGGFGNWIASDGHLGYTIPDLMEAFTDEFLPIANTYPLLIGEIGVNGADGHDMEALTNALEIFADTGIHWAAFWYFTDGVFALLTTLPNYTPTDAGSVIVQAMVNLIATQYQLTLIPATGGTTNPSGALQYESGAIVDIQAIPDSGLVLSHWLLNGSNVGNANPYTVIMNRDYILEPVFTTPTQQNYLLYALPFALIGGYGYFLFRDNHKSKKKK